MKKKLILTMLSIVLLLTMGVMSTLAFLTDRDKVVNVFTVGDVQITLDEAKVTPDGKPVDPEERVQENEYHLLPGLSYTKDPTLTVLKNSEKSYIRIMVTIVGIDKLQAALGQDFLPETVVTGWDNTLWPCVGIVDNGLDADENRSYTYEFRYAQIVDTMDHNDLELKPLFTSFTVPGKLTGEQMQTLKNVQIIVEGHAIQANPFTSADEAWAAFTEQYKSQQGNG